ESIAEDYPPALARLVARALEKEVDKRFATMADLAAALEEAMPSLGACSARDVAAFARAAAGERSSRRAAALHDALPAAEDSAPSVARLVPPVRAGSPKRRTGIGWAALAFVGVAAGVGTAAWLTSRGGTEARAARDPEALRVHAADVAPPSSPEVTG